MIPDLFSLAFDQGGPGVGHGRAGFRLHTRDVARPSGVRQPVPSPRSCGSSTNRVSATQDGGPTTAEHGDTGEALRSVPSHTR